MAHSLAQHRAARRLGSSALCSVLQWAVRPKRASQAACWSASTAQRRSRCRCNGCCGRRRGCGCNWCHGRRRRWRSTAATGRSGAARRGVRGRTRSAHRPVGISALGGRGATHGDPATIRQQVATFIASDRSTTIAGPTEAIARCVDLHGGLLRRVRARRRTGIGRVVTHFDITASAARHRCWCAVRPNSRQRHPE